MRTSGNVAHNDINAASKSFNVDMSSGGSSAIVYLTSLPLDSIERSLVNAVSSF